jgi:D-alanine-D-alanine ligase
MIRIANKHDGAAIHDIASSIKVFSAEEVTCVDELWEESVSIGSELSGYYFIVAEEDGALLGFACYGPRALTTGTFDLYWIAVDQRKKRGGVGRQFMQQSEKDIARLGGRLIIVETSGKAEYAPTRAFYEGIGYQKEAVLKDFYAPGDDLVIFTHKLI